MTLSLLALIVRIGVWMLLWYVGTPQAMQAGQVAQGPARCCDCIVCQCEDCDCCCKAKCTCAATVMQNPSVARPSKVASHKFKDGKIGVKLTVPVGKDLYPNGKADMKAVLPPPLSDWQQDCDGFYDDGNEWEFSPAYHEDMLKWLMDDLDPSKNSVVHLYVYPGENSIATEKAKSLARNARFMFSTPGFNLCAVPVPPAPPKEAKPKSNIPDISGPCCWGTITQDGRTVVINGHDHWIASGTIRQDGKLFLTWTLIGDGRTGPGLYEILANDGGIAGIWGYTEDVTYDGQDLKGFTSSDRLKNAKEPPEEKDQP